MKRVGRTTSWGKRSSSSSNNNNNFVVVVVNTDRGE